MVFSATLALPSKVAAPKSSATKNNKGKIPGLLSVLNQLPFRPHMLHIADLSPSTQVADTVAEYWLPCTVEQRDVYLYTLLAATEGRTLVFANSVACVRRLAGTLALLDLPAIALHAQQQQRQRLKRLD